MKNAALWVLAWTLGILVSEMPSARAGCITVGFDELATGTRVTTQYAGVTFSGRNVNGTAGPIPVIYDPANGTTSEPRCLSAYGDGLNEFSEDYLRLDFAQDQTEVTFNLGVRVGCFPTDTVQVRMYDSGNVLRGTQNVPVNGDVLERVLVFVRVERAAGFRRIEIEAGLAGGCAARFELMDDLSFDIDSTPPIAEISVPTALDCVCNGSTVFGSAYDPDGPILGWRLERKSADAAGWTLITTSVTEIESGALATWTTAAAEGYYMLRLTVTNACELITTATTIVWLDKSLNSLQLRSPSPGAILGGTVCADGTAWDHCGGSFTVEHRPTEGAWTPFDTVSPPWILNDPLGSWETRRGIRDGAYQVRLTATDECDNTSTATATIVVDNTPPIASILSPLECTNVEGTVEIWGTVSDANLSGWVLQYTGGDAAGWVTIASGSSAISNSVLGSWNTSALRSCAYTLRLLATDLAVLDCGPWHNQTEDHVSLNVGGSCDVNHDGEANGLDIPTFVECLVGGG